MNQMNLLQQIKQIDDIMQYISLICDETEEMTKDVSETVNILRKNGFRTETSDMIEQVYLAHINDKLRIMLARMKNQDYEYLKNVKEDLEKAVNRQ